MRGIASDGCCGLDSLTLDVVACNKDASTQKSSIESSKPRRAMVFRTAARTLRLVALSLRDSGPLIAQLGAFGRDIGPSIQFLKQSGRSHGPLPCIFLYDTFGQLGILDSNHKWFLFRGLRSLSLHLSERFIDPDPCAVSFSTASVADSAWRDRTLQQELDTDAHHISSLVNSLSLCSKLE